MVIHLSAAITFALLNTSSNFFPLFFAGRGSEFSYIQQKCLVFFFFSLRIGQTHEALQPTLIRSLYNLTHFRGVIHSDIS